MQLPELLKNIITFKDLPNLAIKDLALDSRKITKDSLFIAIKGHERDGNEYILDAISKGAIAILKEAQQENFCESLSGVPVIHVKQLSKKIGEIAARFYGEPAKALKIFGVTGTNGKTSCTHFLAETLSQLQSQTGLIGTLGFGFYGDLKFTGLTTPDAITLQKILHDFAKQNAKNVAMEVSSHSIHQHRINSIDFEVGLFTNLTQDHLDYHGTMENYANTKRDFLANFPIKHLVINADDNYGHAWLKNISHPSITAYGFKNSNIQNFPQQVSAHDVQLSLQGIHAEVVTPWGEATLQLSLIGEFNLSNALGVLTSLCLAGFPLKDAVNALNHVSAVPGRMQVIKAPNQPLVIVDYAHSPDALEKVLKALRLHTRGKLICVFGCGGDRDQKKRPMMGKIAETLADIAIITNDNPRHESEIVIAQQILAGFLHPNRAQIELNRSKAIENSIQLANINDCILIAGKGAEDYQQIGDERLPFDDVHEVKRCLKILEEKI